MKYYKHWRDAEAIEPLLREYGWHASFSRDDLMVLETWRDASVPAGLKKTICTVTILGDGAFKVEILIEGYRSVYGRRMTSVVHSLPALQTDLALRMATFFGSEVGAYDRTLDRHWKDLYLESDLRGLLDYWDGRPGQLPDVGEMVDPRWFSVDRWETGRICLVDSGSDELYRLAYVADEGMRRRFSQGEFRDEDLCLCLPYAEGVRRMFEAARNLQWVWSVVRGLDVAIDDTVREMVTWWSQVDEVTARPFAQKDRTPKAAFKKTYRPVTPPLRAKAVMDDPKDVQDIVRILNPQMRRYRWRAEGARGVHGVDLMPRSYLGYEMQVRLREDGSFEIHSDYEDHGHNRRLLAVVRSLPALRLEIELLMSYDEEGTGRDVSDAIREQRRKLHVTQRWLRELIYDWAGRPWSIPDTYGLVDPRWFSTGEWVTGAMCLVETEQRSSDGFRLYRLSYVPDDATRDRFLAGGFREDDECRCFTYLDGVRAMFNFAFDLQRVWSIVDDLGVEMNDETRALVTDHVRQKLHHYLP
ncbi:hypothetical protein PT282_03875 [Bifidobacterium sp. ESL0763]|uniref:hypothetical protein n=1 Tax=Bifidobacterium sp. ESL0763 TaxID=2983227 RepID=UPI0023F71197|nr:hypothetical protein [Bifidobacterium sp. ESL0763]MDF7663805.1 hypothetical protein [Bifidobacterium sp. ESL0763]